jgi:hypothetical protein
MPPLIGGGAKQKANNRCSFFPSTNGVSPLPAGTIFARICLLLWNCLARTIPQSPDGAPDDLPKAHLLEKEEVQEEALLPFPRLPTTKSISSEPLYQDLSSTVPIYLRSLPASSRSSFARHLLDIINRLPVFPQTDCRAHPAFPIIDYPRETPIEAISETPCPTDWLPSPRLTHAFLQEPLHLASPIDESIADCCYCLLQLLGHPCFFLRQPAPEVLSSFGTSARHPGTDNQPTPSVEKFITVRRYIPHLPRQILPASLAASLETLHPLGRLSGLTPVELSILLAISHPR